MRIPHRVPPTVPQPRQGHTTLVPAHGQASIKTPQAPRRITRANSFVTTDPCSLVPLRVEIDDRMIPSAGSVPDSSKDWRRRPLDHDPGLAADGADLSCIASERVNCAAVSSSPTQRRRRRGCRHPAPTSVVTGDGHCRTLPGQQSPHRRARPRDTPSLHPDSRQPELGQRQAGDPPSLARARSRWSQASHCPHGSRIDERPNRDHDLSCCPSPTYGCVSNSCVHVRVLRCVATWGRPPFGEWDNSWWHQL